MFLTQLKIFFHLLPALHYGLFAILGILSALLSPFYFLGSVLLLTDWKRGTLGLLLMGMSCLSTYHRIQLNPIPVDGILGIAHVRFDTLKQQAGQWQYQGTLLKFYGDVELRNIPFNLKWHGFQRYSADNEYLIQVRLFPCFGGKLQLKALKDFSWEIVKSGGLAEWRYKWKKEAKRWIYQHYTAKQTQSFLAGLVIGEFDDKELKEQFGKFGLLHLLAISGFHFSLIAAFIDRIFRLFLGNFLTCILTLALLACYFLFLGWGPSVVRAWMTITMFYSGSLLCRRSQALNALGVALLIATWIDPFLLFNLGFQFSVLCTAAILLLQKPVEEGVLYLFPKRDFSTLMSWPLWAQFSYLFLAVVKNAASLSIATSLIALPLSLYYFHYFPCMSLIYNLFFPFLAAISIQLLILAVILTPLHHVNDFFTSWVLNLTYETPEAWNLMIVYNDLSALILILIVILTFLLSIYFQKINKPLIFNYPI